MNYTPAVVPAAGTGAAAAFTGYDVLWIVLAVLTVVTVILALFRLVPRFRRRH